MARWLVRGLVLFLLISHVERMLLSHSNLWLYLFYSRGDLVEKTMKDLPKLDRSLAENEVDKFLMDAEMIDLYIRFQKELEKNPDFVIPEAEQQEEGLFSIRTVLIGYIAYIGFGVVSKVFRGYVADQEIAGTWQDTNIGFIDDWIQKTSPGATQQALQRAAAAVAAAVEGAAAETAATVVSGLDVAGTALDAGQSAVVEAMVQTNFFLM